VHTFAYRRSGSRDVADEATSATFDKALRSMGSFEWRATGIRPWLYRIASNEVANAYRQAVRVDSGRGQLALRHLAGDDDGGEPASISKDTLESTALQRSLDELPTRYREAITLRYLNGLSAHDAAVAMGCSKAVLTVTLHRAMTALRKRMSTTQGGGQ
jgi:RNA polymerase sigma-70 factor, ECF subfamily